MPLKLNCHPNIYYLLSDHFALILYSCLSVLVWLKYFRFILIKNILIPVMKKSFFSQFHLSALPKETYLAWLGRIVNTNQRGEGMKFLDFCLTIPNEPLISAQ